MRPTSCLPLRLFDGQVIPYGDDSFDVVMLVDTLHHTQNPLGLLREAVRVARRAVILKDHTCDGVFARSTLRLMDHVGNARHGVRGSPGTYWPKLVWWESFRALGLVVKEYKTRLGLYGWPACWVFERSLHFIARLDVAR